MSEEVQELLSTKPIIGISRIFKYFAKKEIKGTAVSEKAYGEKDLYKISKGEPLIVKMEFTLQSIILLFSDGKVMSRGKDMGVGREVKSLKKTDFEEVKFFSSDLNKFVVLTIVNISAGENHVVAMDIDKFLWIWGSNRYRQVNPNIEGIVGYKIPNKIDYINTAEHKIAQIYALNNSTMFIASKNTCLMTGSSGEGFLGNKLKDERLVSGVTHDVINFNFLTEFIYNELSKNDKNQYDTFINCRKIFNTKFNLLLIEHYNKSQLIDTLIKTKGNLEAEIDQKTKKTSRLQANIQNASKEIVKMMALLNKYEDKVNKFTLKKDELRKLLVIKENEINQKNIDQKSNNDEIEKVESAMEEMNNEISRLVSKLNDKETNQDLLKKEIVDKKQSLDNLKISKESLITNLQIVIVYIENKEKEKYTIFQEINDLTSKENEILKNRNVIEDMIQILFKNLKSKKNRKDEKFKEKFVEVFRFYERLELITFYNLSKEKPYMTIDDLLETVEAELKLISKDIEYSKSSLSDSVKIELDIIFKMIDGKMHLINEQCNLIKSLYNILTYLEDEIKKRERENIKESKKKIDHSEYIFKNLIIKFLKSLAKDNFEFNTKEDKERIDLDKNDYLAVKRKKYQKIYSKANFNPENKFGFKVNDDFKKFYYQDEPVKQFSWF